MKTRLQTYLHEVLGAAATDLRPCAGSVRLAFFLQDGFEFLETTLAGAVVVLATPKSAEKPSLKHIRAQLAQAEQALGVSIAYCPPSLEPYERRNLIEQKQAFVVPGNQMYLPDLGIDLREYFNKARAHAVKAFSPSTQAFLIRWLLKYSAGQPRRADDIGGPLGYSKMTITRIVRELEGAGIAETHSENRFLVLKLLHTHEESWRNARPYLKSPVSKTVWIKPPRHPERFRLAGLSALSRQGLLAEPAEACYAISNADWSDMGKNIHSLPEAAPGLVQLQIWSYRPDIAGASESVDPLSLWVSLKDDPDDRVQMSLDDMMNQLGW